MKIVYLIVKYLTIIGTFLQGFFEHLTCRLYGVLIEDARYLRANEMCGHVEHELLQKRSVAFGVSFFPFLFNLLFGLVLTSVGSLNIFYLGEFFFPSGVVHIPNFLFLWAGISCLTNLFPQMEDALALKSTLYGKSSHTNVFLKILAAPIFAILYAGAYLQKWGVTLLTSVGFSIALPYIFRTFLPQLFQLLVG